MISKPVPKRGTHQTLVETLSDIWKCLQIPVIWLPHLTLLSFPVVAHTDARLFQVPAG